MPVQSQVVDIQRDIYRDLNFTSHVDAAKYQQYLHMKYTVRSWYNIPEFVVPITFTLIEGSY